jgi:hypothetical protein
MVNAEIKGIGFFPGANDTFYCSASIIDEHIMIFGQNQDGYGPCLMYFSFFF